MKDITEIIYIECIGSLYRVVGLTNLSRAGNQYWRVNDTLTATDLDALMHCRYSWQEIRITSNPGL